ncbi:fructosamine kinase family protein [Actibacterium lipolyticum]|uniref:Fructosamine kinase n=1 Tax=Actibacterium lipolyticum TaxID=1524263 RepID=A0A238KLC5_9RHOB|nr:fructosamine kinase family protein [Actibacterium lipolyticum]SMX43553.1 Fructosamine kinase [Actibacterium lipolyticum]
MANPLSQQISDLLGAPVSALSPLHGGDLSKIYRVTLASGQDVVAKSGPLVGVEAQMLAAIAATGCPAPRVLATTATLIIMEYLPEGPPDWAGLGRALKRLHSATGAGYSWSSDYAFGSVAIPNTAAPDWPTFWAERRLLAAPHALPHDIAQRVEHLSQRLPDLLPHHPPAALLHGDLWAGNIHFTPTGPALIDPASYHGHTEVDLAMLHLFATPGPGFYETYGPTTPEERERRPIYQLWPALVHLRLFGAAYRSMVENLLCDAGS